MTAYNSPEELREQCDAYFDERGGKVLSEAGLALFLGVPLIVLRGWFDGTDHPEFQETVQMAYLRIQEQYESGEIFMRKGMSGRAVFFLRRKRFGGEPPVTSRARKQTDSGDGDNGAENLLVYGENMDDSDFL